MCHLEELYAKYKNNGLVILGFDASDALRSRRTTSAAG
jgi:glutathione peroxidase-family protein